MLSVSWLLRARVFVDCWSCLPRVYPGISRCACLHTLQSQPWQLPLFIDTDVCNVTVCRLVCADSLMSTCVRAALFYVRVSLHRHHDAPCEAYKLVECDRVRLVWVYARCAARVSWNTQTCTTREHWL